jgi:hypothetical protein
MIKEKNIYPYNLISESQKRYLYQLLLFAIQMSIYSIKRSETYLTMRMVVQVNPEKTRKNKLLSPPNQATQQIIITEQNGSESQAGRYRSRRGERKGDTEMCGSLRSHIMWRRKDSSRDAMGCVITLMFPFSTGPDGPNQRCLFSPVPV